MKRRVMITAHSGCEGTEENSLASIKTGVALGADCVEIDVRRDERGKLWLTHDLPADYSGCTMLADAFALICGSGAAVNCDLKEEGALLPTLALADTFGISRERLIFSGSVAPALLEAHPEIVRRCRVFLNSEVLARDLLGTVPPDRAGQSAFFLAHPEQCARRLRALGAEALNAPYQHMPPELTAALRRCGVELSLWTVNEESALRDFLSGDVLNVTTRAVSLAAAIRKTMV